MAGVVTPAKQVGTGWGAEKAHGGAMRRAHEAGPHRAGYGIVCEQRGWLTYEIKMTCAARLVVP